MYRFILTISLTLLLFGGVSAGIIKVPQNYATIQAGIDAAVKGDTVLVDAGTYYENISFKGKAITVASYYLVDGDTTHINNTIIDGSRPSDPNKGSVVSFTSGEDTTSVVCGFTITGGTGTIADAESRVGGGIYCYSSGTRIMHNKITNNSIEYLDAARGGGIGSFPFGNGRYAIIENNIIELNSCVGTQRGQGGGVYLPHGRINNNLIRGNSCEGDRAMGGGIHGASDEAVQRNLYIAGNTVVNNQCASAGDYGGGGGVDIWYSNIQLLGNTINHNQVSGRLSATSKVQGGGVRIWGAKVSVLVKDNTISFNSFINDCRGGGMLVNTCNGVTIQRNRFEGNKAVIGGGLRTAHITGCVVSDNEFIANLATDKGGGIADYDTKPFTIANNVFIKNKAICRGGGLSTYDSDVLIINNICTGNESRRAGGIYIWQWDFALTFVAQIINNTLTANVADSAGGIGVWFHKNAISMNNICWGNEAAFASEIMVLGGELNVVHSDIRGGAANIATEKNGTVNWLAGNIDDNPLFADSAFELSSYQLSNYSPCIGAGIASLPIGGTTYNCPITDFEGNLRPNPAGSKPDMGAYENPLDGPQGPIRVPEQYANIQAGINAAKDGDMVLVRDNTYYENINFKGKAITVASYYLMDGDTTHINNTIIDGSKPSHADSGSVVYFISGEDTTSVLCGFTITKGSGTEIINLWDGTQYFEKAGGGILCFQSGARIVRNRIVENAVYSPDKEAYGGGVAAEAIHSIATVILQDNHISRNKVTADLKRAYDGGVGLSRCHGIVRNNLIEHNSVVAKATTLEAFAGGLACYADTSDRREFIIESNTISHNSVTSYNSNTKCGGILLQGGIRGRFTKNEVSHNELWSKTAEYAIGAGIWIIQVEDSFVLENNIIRENSVKQGNGYGGGVGVGSSLPVINNIIERNFATNGGGFFIHSNSSPQIINNTIIDNKATTGGGFFVRGNSAVYLMNNILWNNQAPTDAAIHIESSTVTTAYCDIQGGWAGTGNINVDPLFIDAKCHLADASPCIDKGNPDAAYNDPEDVNNPGFALFPAKGTVRNDMGAFGGPGSKKTITAIKHDRPNNEAQPNTFALFQNYPNPFNPSTTIEFALPKPTFVTLKIYNLLGEEVATLVAEQRPAGIHKLNWDATGLASGVYLYRLEAGEFIDVKKLILMR